MEKTWVILFLVAFLAAGVLAGFNYEEHSIQENYVEGEIIKGTVNLSLDSEPANSLLSSNFDGNITLIDFLRNNSFVLGEDYNCSTSRCGEDYVVQDAISEFDLDSSQILGLKVSGLDITGIESLSFRVRGNNPETCVTPLVVDFLNSGNVLINDKYEDETCGSANYGCFSNGNADVTITTTSYCNKITLPRGPAYRLGAKVKNSTNGNSAELNMELYNLNGDFIDGCVLPRHTSSDENLECLIDRGIPVQDDYLVCIKRGTLDGVGEPNYKIRSETQDVCGSDDLGLSFTRDYEIFSKVLKSDTADLTVDDFLFQEIYNEDLTDYVYNYIIDEYNGICNPDCVIPVEFSGTASRLTFSEIDFSYRDGNTLVNDDNFYTVEVEDAVVDSEVLEFDLEEIGFVVEDKSKFRFYIDGDEVFNERINVSEGLDFNVNPKFVAFGQETVFRITGLNNITEVEWDFGDGNKEKSTDGSISHSYIEEGEFEMKVSVKAGSGSGSKSFNIFVGDAKESARLTIDKYRERIGVLKDIFQGYPVWLNKVVGERVDLISLEAGLDALEKEYDSVQGDENYTSIMLDLLELNVPASVNTSRSGELPLLIGFENFDVNYIEEISGREADGLKDAVGAWMGDNYDGKIEFEVLSGQYDSGSEAVLTKIKLDLIPMGNSGVSYLIIDEDLEDLRFSTSYGQRAIGDGTYISLRGDRRVIEFAVLNEVSPEELGIYISPDVSQLNLDSREVVDDEGFNWVLFIIGIVILLVFAFIVYIVMQEWYKRNYEAHLFKNENDLYNLINFVYNSRRSGMNDGQIKHNLKRSKWSAEQISYAIRKLDGKRTGMFEIPLFKGMEKRKVRQEIMKRQVSTGKR